MLKIMRTALINQKTFCMKVQKRFYWGKDAEDHAYGTI